MSFPALRRSFLLILAITFASPAARPQTSAAPAPNPSVPDAGTCAGFLADCLHSVPQLWPRGEPVPPVRFSGLYDALFQLTNTPTDERPFRNYLQVTTTREKLNFNILSWNCTRDHTACEPEVTSARNAYVYGCPLNPSNAADKQQR